MATYMIVVVSILATQPDYRVTNYVLDNQISDAHVCGTY
jgi:hypothetical protein